MKISFITTIYNEEKTIHQFLESLNNQSKLPDEIIIVDGGSIDNTLSTISNFQIRVSKTKIIIKKGNRSIGRNEAIKNATGDIIVCSDSGNILNPNWIKNITKPFSKKDVDVVAGYYEGIATNVFQKSILPYAFVMPDKVDPESFLPATRSIAFTKKIWKKAGGFDERLSHNEDYAFAHALKKIHAKIVFARDAIVYWMPRDTFGSAYIMFLRFAYGDAEARIFRLKVFLIFARYSLGLIILLLAILIQSKIIFIMLLLGIFVYILWAINKNYKYVREWQAIYLLPSFQFVSDAAVLIGTIQGIFKVWDTKKML